jgi:hypothetical protein
VEWLSARSTIRDYCTSINKSILKLVEAHSLVSRDLALLAISVCLLWFSVNGIKTGSTRMLRGRVVKRSEDAFLFWFSIALFLAFGVPAAIMLFFDSGRQLF